MTREQFRELVQVRLAWVDLYVDRRITRHHGDVTAAQVEAWEDEAYRKWRETYPALNSAFPSHLPEAVV